ncbi:2,3-bisphosphoglycerate-independent phosphoglycerate mutase [Chryseobacterium carnipullorum]|uniref:2,3-bisphosphoglycerate-independent phosphoglycerate mutase n=1 Tax=Chryseobacterium carnipullorum TaxID=1124835 RepID=A0A376E1I6_CHRCU|nr:2,3-bisphosphoglycerate-independent phosphoglycerate mutase [Chryseobacterium carnipullorum]MDN5396333.1 2,3-bisphosphoglycerate-independent phosphoglycerate mutase [Chryseobacterium sp.]AZA50439.1 2,3-bisphosphoglycerate-independent phosphoglycerate mutase [Chryseobacterium carnipullorum]AZA65308.1 2,3-bisphosphoglycerate-independent phosphoglycerate mutase [Chryseobacterium carnipullorum]MDN5424051.1 2,3-bisphosphoglycerate-independent phosphoglycerate mutase [Chryseobacterium sp.]MDN5476
MSKKAILAILDGWGLGTNPEVSALEKANTPFIDSCYQKFPHTTLEASGLAVGLPVGQMGNSEVGHMNLGAGRVVYQNLVKLNMAVENGTLGQQQIIQDAFDYAKRENKKLHFIGLVSNGGVHSHINHLKGLLTAAQEFGLHENVFVHAFTDGRDCDPHSGLGFIEELQGHMETTVGKLATVIGRYYAMDRDKRWERVKLAYDAMVEGVGLQTTDALDAIKSSYDNNVTDEFLKPVILVKTTETGNVVPVAKIIDGDVVICFNFRTDRGREITEVLTQKDFPEFFMRKLNLHYITLTNYDKTYQNVQVVFDEEVLKETMGEILERNGKTQIRIAETEKYPHVTFFFSGGREEEFNGERRLLCPSPKDVPTYDLKPEMSAYDITNVIVPELENGTADFVCLNFANTDMVGHTGVFEAAVKAAETVDQCIEKVATAAYENGYAVFILADHGNSDVMINPDGTPNTQHSTNLVPFIVMDKDHTWNLKPGKLGDVAPTILKVMGVEIPEIMTGDILVS